MSEDAILPPRIVEIKRIQATHHILDTTRSLLDTLGWYKVDVDDIAKAADVDTTIINGYFPTKQALVLAAYSQLLQPVVEDAEQALTRPWPCGNPAGFIRTLARLLVDRPALAVALLPVSSDHTKVDITTTTKVVIVDFDRLAELFGRLVKKYWRGDSSSGYDLAEAAETALYGMLYWILRHPDRSFEDASRLTLARFI